MPIVTRECKEHHSPLLSSVLRTHRYAVMRMMSRLHDLFLFDEQGDNQLQNLEAHSFERAPFLLITFFLGTENRINCAMYSYKYIHSSLLTPSVYLYLEV